MIKLSPGHILLTSGVGGPNAKWKDRMLSKGIIGSQAAQMVGFKPTRSHAELITGFMGETFAARWRTRMRNNGLSDYIGSEITIGKPAKPITSPIYWLAFDNGPKKFDGDVYPIHRILIQGASSWFAPKWFTKLGTGGHAICSEVVACFYHTLGMAEFEAGWRGWTPADLERLVKQGDAFEVEFDGLLTEEIMRESSLPIFK